MLRPPNKKDGSWPRPARCWPSRSSSLLAGGLRFLPHSGGFRIAVCAGHLEGPLRGELVPFLPPGPGQHGAFAARTVAGAGRLARPFLPRPGRYLRRQPLGDAALAGSDPFPGGGHSAKRSAEFSEAAEQHGGLLATSPAAASRCRHWRRWTVLAGMAPALLGSRQTATGSSLFE